MSPVRVPLLGLITARGGSKGLPRKHLRLLGGRPLILWTVEAVLSSGVCDRIVLSTDDPEIADLCRGAGVDVPFLRPAHLATDTATHVDVVTHALDVLESEAGVAADSFLLLQPTSPFRTANDIRGAVALMRTRKASAVVGVTQDTHRHPRLAMWRDADDVLLPFLHVDPSADQRRQAWPDALFVNGALYLSDVSTFRQTRSLTPPGTLGYAMPPDRSIDIDTLDDWLAAEFSLARAGEQRPDVGI